MSEAIVLLKRLLDRLSKSLDLRIKTQVMQGGHQLVVTDSQNFGLEVDSLAGGCYDVAGTKAPDALTAASQIANWAFENRLARSILEANAADIQSHNYSGMTLGELAAEIQKDWKNINGYAFNYLKNFPILSGRPDEEEVITRFLGNAGTWRGPVARAIKSELKMRLAKMKSKG
jgi:hypothetical protein